jgi:hypothetical protein
MHQITAKFMPHLMSEEQMENRVSMCQDLQGRLERDPEYLSKIITSSETWVCVHNPETRQQLFHWKSPSPCSKRQDKFAQMRRACALLWEGGDIQRVVHYEFVPQKL